MSEEEVSVEELADDDELSKQIDEVMSAMEQASSDGEDGEPDEKLAAQVDGAALIEDIGLDRGEIEWRKEFVDFTEEDVQHLEEMGELFEDCQDEAAEEFYEHLQSYEGTQEILEKSTRSVKELKGTQTQYLVRLSEGIYGTSYFQDRARIGKIHDMLDMPPKHYLGTYMHYNNIIIPRIVESVIEEQADSGGGLMSSLTGSSEDEIREVSEEIADKIMAFLKITNLDMQVAMDTYIHSYTQDMSAMSDEVESAIAELDKLSQLIVQKAQQVDSLAQAAEENSETVADEVSDMSMTVEEIANSAGEVDKMSDRMEESAQTVRAMVGEIDEAVDEADGTRAENREKLETLADSLDDMSDITDQINELADQTSVLANRAGTEATDLTGEAGEKLRNIADQIKEISAEAEKRAEDAERLAENVADDIEDATEALDEIGEEIQEVNEKTSNVSEEMDEVVESSQETSSSMAEISEVTDQQAGIAEQIVEQVEDTAESSEEVSDEIVDVVGVVEKQSEEMKRLNEFVQSKTVSTDQLT